MEPNSKIPKLEIKPDQKPLEPGFSSNLKTIRTYASDMATALNEQQGSVIKIAMAEHNKKERAIKNISPTSKRNLTFMFVSVLAILLGVGAVLYVSLTKKDEVIVVDKKPSISSLILSESNETVSMDDILTAKQLSDTIAALVQRQRSQGVTNIVLTTSTANGQRLIRADEFLAKLESDAGGSFIRSLVAAYMIGIHTTKDANHPFIFFKTTSYETALAGMLDWEKKIFDNVYGIFNIDPSGENAYLFEKKFEDIVIENRDGRILKDTLGNPVLMYVFLSTDTIFITDSFETIKEVTLRIESVRAR